MRSGVERHTIAAGTDAEPVWQPCENLVRTVGDGPGVVGQ
jgi:hypothetical protein